MLITSTTVAQNKDMFYGTWQSSAQNFLSCEDSTYNDTITWGEYLPFKLTIDKQKGTILYEAEPTAEEYKEHYSQQHIECKVKIRNHKIILKRNKIHYSNAPFQLPSHYQLKTARRVYPFEFLSDTELLITKDQFKYGFEDTTCATCPDCKIEFTLKKVETETYPSNKELKIKAKHHKDSVLQTKLHLINNCSSKMVALKAGGEIEFFSEAETNTSSPQNTSEYQIDALGKVSEDTLWAHVTYEHFSFYDANEGYTNTKEKWNVPYKQQSEMTGIPISNITSITYSSPARLKTHNSIVAIGWVSFASAIFVAPLISIDYKNGGFNEQLYYRSAGISLGLATVCLPLSLLTRGKYYPISKASNYGWYIANSNQTLSR